MKVLRATQTWQRAGAYYVRIQGMAKQHSITLPEEFDEHDTPDTKYIVILDDEFPVATCRWYEMEEGSVMIGRVVVLPEYRGKGLGELVIREAEKWLFELGYKKICVDSRDVAVGFYEKLGYTLRTDIPVEKGTFTCVRMEKDL